MKSQPVKTDQLTYLQKANHRLKFLKKRKFQYIATLKASPCKKLDGKDSPSDIFGKNQVKKPYLQFYLKPMSVRSKQINRLKTIPKKQE